MTATAPSTKGKRIQRALEYLWDGYPVIPIKDKLPLVQWKEYQTRLPTDEEVAGWPWDRATGMALVIGDALWEKHPGLWVLDTEHDHRLDAEAWLDVNAPNWKAARLVESGSGGLHVWCKSSGRVATNPGIEWGDIKGANSLAILPMSKSSKGVYKELNDGPLLRLEPEHIPGYTTEKAPLKEILTGPVPNGKRNETLFRLGSMLRGNGMDPAIIETTLQAINQERCNPPLDPDEVTAIAQSSGRYTPNATFMAGTGRDRAVIDTGATLDHFRAYMPEHKYIFTPNGEIWPASSVNARLPRVPTGEKDENGKEKTVAAATWLDQNQPVEQMTWAPGEDELITDKLISHGGWIRHHGATTFNLYRGPLVEHGDADKALHWINHVHKVYPGEAEHIIKWLAHRVQRPGEKINHALVLGGSQGVGKDTLLEPVKYAIGPWNFQEVSPSHIVGRFNGFVKSVILRVSEARDLGDVDRYSFYDHMKVYTAAPPDVLRCDEKNRLEYSVFNVCGVILTTNHKTAGIFLPPDDRRHFVAWSELDASDFTPVYWDFLYRWYEEEGYGHVAAYLASLDLSDFNPKAPPEKTPAFWDIVDANRAPEDAELADVLEALGNPDAVTLARIAGKAPESLSDWLIDRRNSRNVPHRMEAAGYVRVRNESARDGLWVIDGKRQAVYAKKEYDPRERIAAASSYVQDYGK